jgi:hypothetical protein
MEMNKKKSEKEERLLSIIRQVEYGEIRIIIDKQKRIKIKRFLE